MILYALRSINMTSEAIATVLRPLLLLGVRLWLAQIFLLASAIELTVPGQAPPADLYACFDGWLHAESPVKMLVIWVAVVFSLLLAGGLATRFAALVLGILSITAFVFEAGQEQNLLWAFMLGFLVFFGGGALSLDAMVRRTVVFGPLTLPLVGKLDWLNQLLLVALRVWLALVLILGASEALVFIGASTVVAMLQPFYDLAASTDFWSGFFAPKSMVFGYFSHTVHLVLLALAVPFILPGFLTRPMAGLAAIIVLITALNTGRVETLYIAALLGYLAAVNPGIGALDCLFRLNAWAADGLSDEDEVPHIVVVGAGFGGLAAVSKLMRHRCRITLIDRRNHHLFQPLLYQVATAALSPGEIALPIRGLFRGQNNVRVLLGEVLSVDRAEQKVKLGDRRIHYDYLIVASGARSTYFGKTEWEQHAPALKQIEDATYMRSKLLAAFEHAEDAKDDEAREAWLNFVIVGAGPTGVEMAGALAELAHHGLTGEFSHFDPANARIILLDRGTRVLRTFPQACSDKSAKMLEALGVELMHGAIITDINEHGVTLQDGTFIKSRTVLWTAGVQASPAAQWLGVEPGPGGRVPVNARMSLTGDDKVFVIGDVAAVPIKGRNPFGGLVPGLAPAAKQAGAYAARVIVAKMHRRRAPGRFRYVHQGSLATIGRAAAVADFGWIRLSGAPAWWLWGVVHVGFLTGLRNRIAVALQWFWAYITYHRSTRLITGPGAQLKRRSEAPAYGQDI